MRPQEALWLINRGQKVSCTADEYLMVGGIREALVEALRIPERGASLEEWMNRAEKFRLDKLYGPKGDTMPCGGIYPFRGAEGEVNRCYQCSKVIEKPEELFFCDEWDCYIHRGCIVPFLGTEDGQVVVNHGHVVHFGREE